MYVMAHGVLKKNETIFIEILDTTSTQNPLILINMKCVGQYDTVKGTCVLIYLRINNHLHLHQISNESLQIIRNKQVGEKNEE